MNLAKICVNISDADFGSYYFKRQNAREEGDVRYAMGKASFC